MDGPNPFDHSGKPTHGHASLQQIIRHRIENGIYVPERVPQIAFQACEDPQIKSAEEILGRIHCSIPADQSREYAHQRSTAERRKGRFALNKLIRPLENAALKKWAQAQRLLLDNADFQIPWERTGCFGESEHDVYHAPERGLWEKRNHLTHHGTWLEYFHRLLLHNWLFPDTSLFFKGFVEHEGQLLPLTTQHDIQALRGATMNEIDRFMEKMGFFPIRHTAPSRQYDYLHPSLGIEVNDLHDENVLFQPNGDLSVIDPIPMMEETSKITRITRELTGDTSS